MRLKALDKQVEHWRQEIDWSKVPPHEKAFVEALRHDVLDTAHTLLLHTQQLETRFEELAQRIAKYE